MNADNLDKICVLMYSASLNYLDDLDDANGENVYIGEMHKILELLKDSRGNYIDQSLCVGYVDYQLGDWRVYWSVETMSANARLIDKPGAPIIYFTAYKR